MTLPIAKRYLSDGGEIGILSASKAIGKLNMTEKNKKHNS